MTFLGSFLRGTIAPVILRAVCLVRAIAFVVCLFLELAVSFGCVGWCDGSNAWLFEGYLQAANSENKVARSVRDMNF